MRCYHHHMHNAAQCETYRRNFSVAGPISRIRLTMVSPSLRGGQVTSLLPRPLSMPRMIIQKDKFRQKVIQQSQRKKRYHSNTSNNTTPPYNIGNKFISRTAKKNILLLVIGFNYFFFMKQVKLSSIDHTAEFVFLSVTTKEVYLWRRTHPKYRQLSLDDI